MSFKNALIHALSTLEYRAAKSIEDCPSNYSTARVSAEHWSAQETLSHMTDVLRWAHSITQGQESWELGPEVAWPEQVAKFRRTIRELKKSIAETELDTETQMRLLQGPIADVLTHTGQLATLRRLAGAPVPGENFFRAPIATPESS